LIVIASVSAVAPEGLTYWSLSFVVPALRAL
jgi:hypothetical protein